MATVDVWQGSIADADVDVLVNASNTMLWLGSGVSGAIAQACGRTEFQQALDDRLKRDAPEGLDPGAVVITDAGAHPRARYVAHVAVMDYRKGPQYQSRPDEERIERGLVALWTQLAALPQRVSIGMVALGAGTGGLGLRTSVGLACKTLQAQLERDEGSIGSVVFVAFDVLEFANTVSTVRHHFEIDSNRLSRDVRRLVDTLD